MINKGSFLNKSAAFWLPVWLFGLTYLLLGFYYETNDDIIISLLLRGIVIQPPLNDLSLYFHGTGYGLALLYKFFPQCPWYGLFLYLILCLTTTLAFILVIHAVTTGNFLKVLALVIIFYVSTWLEHVMLFNYMRVPVLLAGTSFLLLQNTNRKCSNVWLIGSGVLFLLALSIRPSAALLGFLLVWPAAFIAMPAKKNVFIFLRPFFLFVVVGLGFLLYLEVNQKQEKEQYRQLDWLKSTILDFGIYKFEPQQKQDSLAMDAIQHWFLADTIIINKKFYERAGSISHKYVLQIASDKIYKIIHILIRDHFMVLVFNLVIIFYVLIAQNRSRTFWVLLIGYQVYFWSLIFLIGIYMKLPPRLITPCLSLYTLVHLGLLSDISYAQKIKFRMVWFGLLIIPVTLQIYKAVHRAHLQRQQQQVNENFIFTVGINLNNKIIIAGDIYEYMGSLSPFRNYSFGSNAIFFLTGWQTLDPANQLYFQKLTGQPSFARAVIALSRSKNTVWLMSPEFYSFLQTYFKSFYGQDLGLKPVQSLSQANSPVLIYKPGILQ